MRTPRALAMLLLALAAITHVVSAAEGDLELWLAAGAECNSCSIFDTVAKQRSYGTSLQNGDRRVPIVRMDKEDLPQGVVDQLPESIGARSRHWSLQLIVIALRGDEVLYAGNIAESADLRELRYEDAVMYPPAQPDPDHPSRRHSPLYGAFFEANWNLEYFLDVALQRRAPREEADLVDLQAAGPLPQAPRIVLWGSAATPLANANFISTRLAEAQKVFAALSPEATQLTLHGHGPQQAGRDESVIVNDQLRFRRASLTRDLSATAEDLNRVLSAVAQEEQARTLLFQGGHAGPTGAPLWGHGLTLGAEHLAPLSARGELVMVSGACHGGQFAQAVSCGFFAAHPQVTATGCQLSASAIAGSDDYLRLFLQYLRAMAADGTPTSLHAAHWYASARLEHHQVPYSTSDELIAEALTDMQDQAGLPSRVSVETLRDNAHLLPTAEANAVDRLTEGLDGRQQIGLYDYIDRNRAADEQLHDARELTSAQRNAALDLPYPLALALLARRILHRQHHPEDDALASLLACEMQPLRALLDSPAPPSTP